MRIGNWESAIRGLPGAAFLMESLTSIIVSTQTSFHREHTVTDGHGTITATGPISERGRTTPIGATVPVFLAPGLFTGNGTMTWTPTLAQCVLNYSLYGMRMLLDIQIGASVIGGALNTSLQVQIPDGWYCAYNVTNQCIIVDNGVRSVGTLLAVGGTNLVQVLRMDFANWTATPVATGQIMFEVRTA